MKVLIVGGVAGGASAAARLRRLDENAEIILFERGEHISFANCGLPYYIGDVIAEREKLLVTTPDTMRERFRVDVRTLHEVMSIDPKGHRVRVRNYQDGQEYEETYDKLILSPGANPIKPPLPGIESGRVFTLRSIPDTDAIKGYVTEHRPQRAVVVGGGFIGLEMAENLLQMGMQVDLVELAPQVMTTIDREMAAFVHEHLREKGVNLHLNNGVAGFTEQPDGSILVAVNQGGPLPADLVVLAIGVRPDSRLAREAGLQVSSSGAIVVNRRLQTSHPDIYALGDAIEVEDFVTGRRGPIPLAGPANKQGRIAANNIVGIEEEYQGTQGTAIVKVFDLVVASTGNSERILRSAGVPFESIIIHPGSHAGYYPGALPMTIKLIFAPDTGKILGAQIVGYDGVDKRIDVLATAIRFGGTVFDLQGLELAYAPPFSSAKDPNNMAGYVAGNVINGHMPIAHWGDVESMRNDGAFILDVRDPIETEMGAIDGAVNIPVAELRSRLSEVPKDRPVLVYCAVGLRAYVAVRVLSNHGYTQVKNLSGGFKTYDTITRDLAAVGSGPSPDGSGGGSKETAAALEPLTEVGPSAPAAEQPELVLDACGLQCPGPIMQVFGKMKSMNPGQILRVKATDPGFARDISAWCSRTGNNLLDSGREKDAFYAVVQKGDPGLKAISGSTAKAPAAANEDKTIVVFSGDLDKAIASFIIANGAAAMGRKVTMFFTFWGLNVLRRPENLAIKKPLLDKMFGAMMPRGSSRLQLSKMNMGGIGAKLIRKVMQDKNVDSLEALIGQAKLAGIRLVACQMSMDVMGIRPEELIDGVEIGGVASYLAAAEESNVNLFI